MAKGYSITRCSAHAFAGHAVALWKLKNSKKAPIQYQKAIDIDERWRNDIHSIAAEYSWTDTMVQIAQQIIAGFSSN